jgi:nitrate reductase NapD
MSVINVCGVLVQVRPTHVDAVRGALAAESGVEVHATTNDGRLIVTIEKETAQQTSDALHALQNMDKVLCASLVYQFCDDAIERER